MTQFFSYKCWVDFFLSVFVRRERKFHAIILTSWLEGVSDAGYHILVHDLDDFFEPVVDFLHFSPLLSESSSNVFQRGNFLINFVHESFPIGLETFEPFFKLFPFFHLLLILDYLNFTYFSYFGHAFTSIVAIIKYKHSLLELIYSDLVEYGPTFC